MQFHDNRFHLIWTPFLSTQGRTTLQAVGLVCPPSLGSGGDFTLKIAGRKLTARPCDLPRFPTQYQDQNAPAVYFWNVPRPARKTAVHATWTTPQGYAVSDRLELLPARPMNVHVVYKSHFDLGYTEPAADVIAKYQTVYLDRLFQNLEQTADRRPGRRFCWTMPVWLLERCLDDKPHPPFKTAVTAERRRKLDKYIRAGRVSFGLMPFTPHSEFFGLEEMCRSFLPARRLAERFGVPVPRAAKVTDVPAHTASYAMALAACGGEFLQIGTNPESRKLDTPPVFWWKLPDEQRILCHYNGTYGLPIIPPPEWPHADYLAVQVSHDNAGPPDLGVLDQVEWIASHFEQPVYRVGRLEDFADSIVQREGKRLPVIEGEPIDWWIHGIASQAGPTAQARRTKDRLPAAETLRTIVSLASGKSALDADKLVGRAYESLGLYTEHTWGDHASDIDDAFPKGGPFTAAVSTDGRLNAAQQRWVQSWRDKAAFAADAASTTAAIEKQAFDEAKRMLAGGGKAGRGRTSGDVGIVLFNVTGWKRGGLVRMSDAGLPAGEFELVDASTGGRMLYHRDRGTGGHDGTIEFVAPLVPAGGYLYLEVQPVTARNLPGPEADWNANHLTLHFESYSLQFHNAGGMCRWHDRARSMQWCSNEVDHPMGTFLYHMPGSKRIRAFSRQVHGNFQEAAPDFFHRRYGPRMSNIGPIAGGKASVTPHVGPLRSQVVVEAAMPARKSADRRWGGPKRYRTTFTAYRGQRDLRVKIELLDKPATYAVEAGYGFFPFYGSDPFVLIDRIAHLVEPSQDIMPGSNTAHMAVGRGIRIEHKHAGMNFYPLDTPLVGFGQPGAYAFSEQRDYDDSVLYPTLFANTWGTNFAQWQAGDFAYEFVCRPTGNDEWDGGLARGGLEVFRPIVGTVVQGFKQPPAREFVQVDSDLVHLVAMKPAAFGKGLVLRLWSADPDGRTAKLTLPFVKRGARLDVCDLLERPTGRRISLNREGVARVPMKPHEIVTLICKS